MKNRLYFCPKMVYTVYVVHDTEAEMFENIPWQFMFDWEPEAADNLAQQMIKEKAAGKKPSSAPIAVFTYGMPGSGKSRLTQHLSVADDSLVSLSLDEIFQRSPHYEEIVCPARLNHKEDAFSNPQFMEFGADVMGYAIERLMAQSYSVALDGLGGRLLADTYKYLENSGYRPEILVAAVPKRIMDMNMLTRFVAVRNQEDKHFSFTLMRRPEMVKYYSRFVDAMQAADFNIKIINPGNSEVLFSSAQPEGRHAGETFLKEFMRPLTPREEAELKRRSELLCPQIDKLTKTIERRQCRNAVMCSLYPYQPPRNLQSR